MFQFDFKELWDTEKYGVFISGAPGSGKTNLAFFLADTLIKNNTLVYVFDPTGSQTWEKESSVPNCEEVTSRSKFFVLRKRSTIYDISALAPTTQKVFVDNFCRVVHRRERTRIRSGSSGRKTFLIFEEAQNYVSEERSPTEAHTEHVRNLIHVGRNINVRFALLTQFPSSVDKREIKYCRLRFFGHCEDPEDIEYLRPLIKDKVNELSQLRCGQFFYYREASCKQIETTVFKKS